MRILGVAHQVDLKPKVDLSPEYEIISTTCSLKNGIFHFSFFPSAQAGRFIRVYDSFGHYITLPDVELVRFKLCQLFGEDTFNSMADNAEPFEIKTLCLYCNSDNAVIYRFPILSVYQIMFMLCETGGFTSVEDWGTQYNITDFSKNCEIYFGTIKDDDSIFDYRQVNKTAIYTCGQTFTPGDRVAIVSYSKAKSKKERYYTAYPIEWITQFMQITEKFDSKKWVPSVYSHGFTLKDFNSMNRVESLRISINVCRNGFFSPYAGNLVSVRPFSQIKNSSKSLDMSKCCSFSEEDFTQSLSALPIYQMLWELQIHRFTLDRTQGCVFSVDTDRFKVSVPNGWFEVSLNKKDSSYSLLKILTKTTADHIIYQVNGDTLTLHNESILRFMQNFINSVE